MNQHQAGEYRQTNRAFNTIVFGNWTSNEMSEVLNRETAAAIDHEAYVLWLMDAAP